MLQDIQVFDVLTLIAIAVSPILASLGAVWVTRKMDERRETRANRLAVFKTLMRTRGTRIHHEHVGALNLVEIEFYDEHKVSSALQKYFEHLNGGGDGADFERWLKTSDHLFTKLLSEMAKSLGYGIEQLQILTGGYAPKGWEDAENRHAEVQRRLIELLNGRRPLPVIIAGQQVGTAANAGNDDKRQQAQMFVPAGFPPPPN